MCLSDVDAQPEPSVDAVGDLHPGQHRSSRRCPGGAVANRFLTTALTLSRTPTSTVGRPGIAVQPFDHGRTWYELVKTPAVGSAWADERHRHEAVPGHGQICQGGIGRQGSEAHVKLMELKDKTELSREQAAARLHAIAEELASGNDVVIEREEMRFVAHVPDRVNLKVEFEIEDDGTELEIELTW